MREIAMVLPHYQNLGMWAEQQRVWASYPDELRACLHVVVVDDCSPKGLRPGPKSVTVDGLASLQIFRLMEHRRWNWLACRNLGAEKAPTGWLLLTDMDHVLPEVTLRRLVEQPLNENDAYRFGRVTATRTWPYELDDCTPYKSHNDTWLITRRIFNYDDGTRFVRGYDERLSGCYGTSGEFKDRVLSVARSHVILPQPMIRYPREVIADASTPPTVYTRKNDPVNDEDLQQRKALRACVPNWRPLHGLIAHTPVYASERKAVAV